MLKLKVCGLKYEENIQDVLRLSPDMIGLIFYEGSPRNVVNNIPRDLLDKSRAVGVFVDPKFEFIQDRLKQFGLSFVQLHGHESPQFCMRVRKLNVKIIKAFRVDDQFNFNDTEVYTEVADYFLFDTKGKMAGGNGKTFNWNKLKEYKGSTPFFLSGGISEDMAVEIKKLNLERLYGIDINSRFELDYGMKDVNKIKKLKNELFS